MRVLNEILIGTAALMVTASSFANTTGSTEYIYRTKLVGTEQSCEQEAVMLGQRFFQVSHIKPSVTKCVSVSKIIFDRKRGGTKEYKVYTLEMNYLLDKGSHSQSVYQSYYGNSGSRNQTNDYNGMFRSFSDCLSNLAALKVEFIKFSGLEPFLVTCDLARSTDETTYVARLDTYGEPKTKLFAVKSLAEIFRNTVLSESVSKLIAATGGTIVAKRDGTIYYYSKVSVKPNFNGFGRMNLSDCLSQTNEIDTLLKSKISGSYYRGCLRISNQGKYQVEPYGIWNNFAFFHKVTALERYDSFSECQSDKERVKHSFVDGGLAVTVAICSINLIGDNQGIYTMKVYTK